MEQHGESFVIVSPSWINNCNKLSSVITTGSISPVIHSFILNIYIAPLQENYSEALPTPARIKSAGLRREKTQVTTSTPYPRIRAAIHGWLWSETRRSKVLEMNDKLEIGLEFWQLVGPRLGVLREGETRARFCRGG